MIDYSDGKGVAMAKATIADIAREAQVSVTTVSRFIKLWEDERGYEISHSGDCGSSGLQAERIGKADASAKYACGGCRGR